MNSIASLDGSRNIYWPYYTGEIPMITKNQKERLTALIYQNVIEENERELRLSELDDITQADADYALFQFSQGIWS